MKSLLAVSVLLLVSNALGKQLPDPETPSKHGLDLTNLPVNTVAVEGMDSIILTCSVQGPSTAHSMAWVEYAWTPNGGPISDNENILDSHPQSHRYRIKHDNNFEYSLEISNITMGDGGTYLCIDQQANPATEKRRHTCSLTVVAAELNCSTTIRDSGTVLEGQYISNDCTLRYQGGLIPNMTWTGVGPFAQAYVATEHSVWAGMALNATRDMDTRAHQMAQFMTGYFLPVDGDTASNVPPDNRVHQGSQMFVLWGPTNMNAGPIKPVYEAGEILTCVADAFPLPTYLWQNLRTNELTAGQTVRIEEAWRGFNQSMRCEARNTIEGTIYAQSFFVAVDVAPLTTPTTTTPAPTTTPPPAVSPCRDLSGPWLSVSPTAASLCIRLNNTQSGALTGLLKNDSDTYWVDIIGRAQANKWDQVGFNGIWPADIGVSSFIGECHRCHGVENLLVNVVSRSKGSPCGVAGPVQFTTQYHFLRADGALQCPNIPTFF
jgi:hypothetical protein